MNKRWSLVEQMKRKELREIGISLSLFKHPTIARCVINLKASELKTHSTPESLVALGNHLKNHVAKEIGPIAKPDEIRFTDALPKTRSGKIMRRLLREMVTTGKTTGDTSTLEDFSALEKLRADEE